MIILANRLAEAVLFDWDKEEVVKLAKEVAVACKENIDFTCLVKRMRLAQKRQEYTDFTLDREAMYECRKLTKQRESEVDEYLKKMENIDKRKALEAENTEFDYGHNVKHYREN